MWFLLPVRLSGRNATPEPRILAGGTASIGSLAMPNDITATYPPVQLVSAAQQAAGEAAYLTVTKYKSAVADYPAVVRAILEAGMRAIQ